MTCASGDVFFFEAKLRNDLVYFWVNYFGSSDDAKNFTVDFSIHNLNYRESFNYNGPVHTLDKNQNEISDKHNCFSIRLDAVLRCLYKNLDCLNVMIKIKNVKDQIFGKSSESDNSESKESSSESEESDDSEDQESDESEKKPTVKKRRRS